MQVDRAARVVALEVAIGDPRGICLDNRRTLEKQQVQLVPVAAFGGGHALVQRERFRLLHILANDEVCHEAIHDDRLDGALNSDSIHSLYHSFCHVIFLSLCYQFTHWRCWSDVTHAMGQVLPRLAAPRLAAEVALVPPTTDVAVILLELPAQLDRFGLLLGIERVEATLPDPVALPLGEVEDRGNGLLIKHAQSVLDQFDFALSVESVLDQLRLQPLNLEAGILHPPVEVMGTELELHLLRRDEAQERGARRLFGLRLRSSVTCLLVVNERQHAFSCVFGQTWCANALPVEQISIAEKGGFVNTSLHILLK